MAATAERHKLTAILLDEIEATEYPSKAHLDRVERLISTREELEDYIGVLMQKLEGKLAPYSELLDRVERLLSILQQVDQQETR